MTESDTFAEQARPASSQRTPDEVRAWVINRWMYQSRIPMKDAAFMSRVEDPDLRRAWRKRIEDHDGGVTEGGGTLAGAAPATSVTYTLTPASASPCGRVGRPPATNCGITAMKNSADLGLRRLMVKPASA